VVVLPIPGCGRESSLDGARGRDAETTRSETLKKFLAVHRMRKIDKLEWQEIAAELRYRGGSESLRISFLKFKKRHPSYFE
jgi:hypothetical protein